MTDVPIVVSIKSQEAAKGKQAVVRSLQDIRKEAAKTDKQLEKMGPTVEKSSKQAANGIGILKRAITGIGLTILAREILELGNSYSELRNRISLTTDSFEEQEETLERLFDIANKNRAPVEQLVGLYQKVTIASKELGSTQEEAFKFTELVAQGLAIQGGAAGTANGALLQLSQSLGSGIVRAEEFNSILEGAFPIAQAAAKGLDRAGGSVAKLRQLIVGGEVTSKQFFDALLSQADELDETFQKIQPTVRSASIVLRNNLVKAMDAAEGVFSLLADAILLVANNLDKIAKAAVIAGSAMASLFTARLIGNVTQTVRQLVALEIALGANGKASALFGVGLKGVQRGIQAITAAMAANPLGLLLVALTTAISSIVLFKDEISLGKDSLATLGDFIDVIAEDIGAAFSEISQWFTDTFGPLSDMLGSIFGDVEFSIKGMLEFTVNIIDRLIGIWRGAFNAIVAVFKNLPGAFVDIFTEALDGALEIVQEGINTMIGWLNNLPGIDIGEVVFGNEDEAEGSAAEFGKKISDAFSEGFNQDTIADNLQNVFDRAEDKARERIANDNKPKKDTDTDNLQNVFDRAEDKARERIANDNKPKKDTDTDTPDKILDNATTKVNEFGKLWEDTMSKSGDVLMDFVKTGKADFSSLIEGFILDLGKLALQKALIEPLSDSLSSFASGLFSGSSGGGATGGGGGDFLGSVASAAGSLFGYDQGVDYVPRDMVAQVHKGEKIVSAADNKNGGSGNANITVNMIMPNVTDHKSFKENQAQTTANMAKTLQQGLRRTG